MATTKKPFTMEFIFRASPSMLYQFFTQPSSLAQWFSESADVDKDKLYTFIWSGSEEQAQLIDSEEDVFARFRWIEGPEDEYFELRAGKSEITGDTVLFVTDFAESYDLEDQQQLWSNQIGDLKTRIGG